MVTTTICVVGGLVIAAEAAKEAAHGSLGILEMRDSTWWQPLTTVLGPVPVVVATLIAVAAIITIHLMRRKKKTRNAVASAAGTTPRSVGRI
jgi:CBS domain-containing protein